MRQLAEELVRLVAERLAPRGWALVDHDEAEFESHAMPEVIYGLSLNMTTKGGLALYPVLGVTPAACRGLYSRFLGLPESNVASIGTGLADLLHQAGHSGAPYTRWYAKSADELDSVCEVFHADLHEFGWPYLQSFTTSQSVISQLEATARNPNQFAHLAIVCASAGMLEPARRALVAYEELSASQPASMVEQSRRFVAAFASHFEL